MLRHASGLCREDGEDNWNWMAGLPFAENPNTFEVLPPLPFTSTPFHPSRFEVVGWAGAGGHSRLCFCYMALFTDDRDRDIAVP